MSLKKQQKPWEDKTDEQARRRPSNALTKLNSQTA